MSLHPEDKQIAVLPRALRDTQGDMESSTIAIWFFVHGGTDEVQARSKSDRNSVGSNCKQVGEIHVHIKPHSGFHNGGRMGSQKIRLLVKKNCN